MAKSKKPVTFQEKIEAWVDKEIKLIPNSSGTITKESILKEGTELFLRTDDNDATETSPAEIERILLNAISSHQDRNLARDFEDWLETTSGVFTVDEVVRVLGITTKRDRANLYVIASRLAKEKIIERHGNKSGQYRKVEENLEIIDWKTAPIEPLDVKLPLGLSDMVDLYPGNIVVVAGETDQGKTSFLFNVIKMNMDKWKIHYFNSEMGETELKKRLGFFENTEWAFTAYKRHDQFADVIRQDEFNIVDFMEVYDAFWEVGGWIKDIHKKIGKGICFVAIQKNRGQEYGRGGQIALEKPRLYLTMSRDYDKNVGVMKILKAKNWKTHINPNGQIQEFNIINASEFISRGGWHRPEDLAQINGKKTKREWWHT